MTALQKELSTAIAAVVRASRLTQKVFKSLQAGQKSSAGTVTKVDKSPVTIADYGSQAIVNAVLQSVFPADPIVGEEDSNELRVNTELRKKVWNLVSSTLQSTSAKEIEQVDGQIRIDEEMLDMIDKGNFAGGNKGRFWTLDPIDGTQGFLRGGQYAVCLALIIDGKVKVGVLACPNLPISFKDPSSSERGLLLYGVEGGNAFQTTLKRHDQAAAQICQMKPVAHLSEATFCESVESGHSSHDQQSRISQILGIKTQSVRMDSQAKYATLTRGDADIYLRLPVNMKYEEKIWDHASGSLLVELAGGKVTDMYGEPLDFGKGRTLKSKGVIACEKSIHGKVIEAVKQTLEEK